MCAAKKKKIGAGILNILQQVQLGLPLSVEQRFHAGLVQVCNGTRKKRRVSKHQTMRILCQRHHKTLSKHVPCKLIMAGTEEDRGDNNRSDREWKLLGGLVMTLSEYMLGRGDSWKPVKIR